MVIVHIKITRAGWWLEPLWQIWVRQLGWWNSQLKNNPVIFQSPPTREPPTRELLQSMPVLPDQLGKSDLVVAYYAKMLTWCTKMGIESDLSTTTHQHRETKPKIWRACAIWKMSNGPESTHEIGKGEEFRKTWWKLRSPKIGEAECLREAPRTERGSKYL